MKKSLGRLVLGVAAAVVGVSAVMAPSVAAQYSKETAAKAVIGQKAPDFTLTDTNGNKHSLSELSQGGKVVVIEWFNPDCPYVKLHHATNTTMRDTFNAFKDQGVVWVAVNSGAEGKQGAGLERNQSAVEEFGITYPVLMDDMGDVGRLYGAKTTPHMFIIDKEGMLVYAGAIDSDASGKRHAEADYVNYVKQALKQVLAGETVTTPETRAYGCSVKY